MLFNCFSFSLSLLPFFLMTPSWGALTEKANLPVKSSAAVAEQYVPHPKPLVSYQDQFTQGRLEIFDFEVPSSPEQALKELKKVIEEHAEQLNEKLRRVLVEARVLDASDEFRDAAVQGIIVQASQIEFEKVKRSEAIFRRSVHKVMLNDYTQAALENKAEGNVQELICDIEKQFAWDYATDSLQNIVKTYETLSEDEADIVDQKTTAISANIEVPIARYNQLKLKPGAPNESAAKQAGVLSTDQILKNFTDYRTVLTSYTKLKQHRLTKVNAKNLTEIQNKKKTNDSEMDQEVAAKRTKLEKPPEKNNEKK